MDVNELTINDYDNFPAMGTDPFVIFLNGMMEHGLQRMNALSEEVLQLPNKSKTKNPNQKHKTKSKTQA